MPYTIQNEEEENTATVDTADSNNRTESFERNITSKINENGEISLEDFLGL